MRAATMPRALKWVLAGLAVLLLVFGAALFAAQRWLDSEDFRVRIEREAAQALGVPLRLQSIQVALWPLPGLSLLGIEVAVKPPISAARVDVRPQWLSLLGGAPKIAALRVKDAALPQAGLDALQAAIKAKPKGQAQSALPDGAVLLPPWLPKTTVLEGIIWTSARGASWTLNAGASLGDKVGEGLKGWFGGKK